MSKQEIKIDTKEVQSLEEVIELIKTHIKPFMDEWEERTFNSLKERYKLFQKKWDELRECGRNTPYWDIYPEFMNKSEYQLVWGRRDYDIKMYIHRDRVSKENKIDESVRKKVIDEIKEVKSGEVYSSLEMGEIDGVFELLTVEGETRYLEFESVLAGGYNIQKLHFRTLFKYKKNR